MYIHEDFDVNGNANELTMADETLQSTREETRHVHKALVEVNDYEGNEIVIRVDQTEICRVSEYLFNTHGDTGGTNTPYSTSKQSEIPIDLTLEVGQEIEIGIDCGGTATNLVGAWVYEPV
jgi:hypothetical protein